MKKFLTILIIICGIVGGTYLFVSIKGKTKNKPTTLSPIVNEENLITEDEIKTEVIKSELQNKETINILLLGIDIGSERRANGQTGFNTDVMILASYNTTTNRLLFTSIPRDLWINGNKINALYTVYGEDTLKDAFEKVTGQEIHGTIRVDFDSFRWLVDNFGGLTVDVQRTFTDNTFPYIDDSGIHSVTFEEGTETMDGDRALTFARSRKGNNGEGSDLMRAKRQHLILMSMIKGISGTDSVFWPMDIEKSYNLVTNNKYIQTDLTLDDVRYLWSFYDQTETLETESFVIDGDYVYHPGMYPQSDYHAWVFIPREETFSQLHTDIENKLVGIFEKELPETVAGTSDTE